MANTYRILIVDAEDNLLSERPVRSRSVLDRIVALIEKGLRG